jgi:asparagine synthase (glutamine-hydrolysing)
MGGRRPASRLLYIRAMSGICGYVGEAAPDALERMLGAISYRGDRTDTASLPGVGLGYRWWSGRPNKSPGIHRGPAGTLVACAGTLAAAVSSPAAAMDDRLARPNLEGLNDLDGAFGAARWDAQARTLTLIRDPFGVRSLYWIEHARTFYFATELKQLLALGHLPLEVDPAVVHKYLTFSFVPGEPTPLRGVRRLPPGHLLTFAGGKAEIAPYFELREEIAAIEQADASRQTWQFGRAAVERRLVGEERVGLYLSGGIDSSAVGVWLHDLGAKVQAFTLDFGADSVEREEADDAAQHLGLPLERVPADGNAIASIFEDLVYKLDLPFGDPVTGPHFLLGRAARAAGLVAVFNGEGGDQLFGGWTSKPMVAAAVYGSEYGEETPEQQYLKSYHRFYGLEDELYSPGLRGQRRRPRPAARADRQVPRRRRRAHAAPPRPLDRHRLERLPEHPAARGADDQRARPRRPGAAVRPAARSLELHPATNLKLHGACEKYVLKLSMQKRLPGPLVWRRKFGMSVPVTDWLMGPLKPLVDELLGERAIRARGWFRPELVRKLREGEDVPSETRRRRIGEKLWTLLMLEAWMRRFVDQKGTAP